MKGKPFLVAIAAFVIVVFGGVAIAGVGSLTTGSSTGAAELGSEPMALDVPDWDTTTTTVTKTTTTTTPAAEPIEAKTESAEADKSTSEPTKSDEPKETEKEAKVADLFSLDFPKDGERFTSKVVAFGGEASDGATVHRGKYEAIPDGGKWVMELVLSPGKNKVAFKATNGNGDIEAAAVTVYYDAPASEDTNHEKKDDSKKDDSKHDDKYADTKFSANQKYGSCGEDVPYDKFWGTAKPGSKITASSPYGSNSTVAGEKGHWEMKVKFPDAPKGEKFTVTITSTDGGSKSFTFVNTGGKDH